MYTACVYAVSACACARNSLCLQLAIRPSTGRCMVSGGSTKEQQHEMNISFGMMNQHHQPPSSSSSSSMHAAAASFM